MTDEGGAVALVAEAPDRAVVHRLEPLVAAHGHRVGEVGHRIVAGDRLTREAVHHHPLGGALGERHSGGGKQYQQRNHEHSHPLEPGPGGFPFMPS